MVRQRTDDQIRNGRKNVKSFRTRNVERKAGQETVVRRAEAVRHDDEDGPVDGGRHRRSHKLRGRD